jgi:hypothetical protein
MPGLRLPQIGGIAGLADDPPRRRLCEDQVGDDAGPQGAQRGPSLAGAADHGNHAPAAQVVQAEAQRIGVDPAVDRPALDIDEAAEDVAGRVEGYQLLPFRLVDHADLADVRVLLLQRADADDHHLRLAGEAEHVLHALLRQQRVLFLRVGGKVGHGQEIALAAGPFHQPVDHVERVGGKLARQAARDGNETQVRALQRRQPVHRRDQRAALADADQRAVLHTEQHPVQEPRRRRADGREFALGRGLAVERRGDDAVVESEAADQRLLMGDAFGRRALDENLDEAPVLGQRDQAVRLGRRDAEPARDLALRIAADE